MTRMKNKKMKQRANVWPNSASAMKDILKLHFPTGSIVDVNYGLGVFYSKVGRDRVTGVDIRPTADVIADARDLPFENDSFDIAVCDPPYKRGDGLKYESRYGKAPKTETQVTGSYFEMIPECVRVAKKGMVIKTQDGTDGHRFIPRHVQIIEFVRDLTGLYPHDMGVNVRRKLSNTMAQGRPHFFQNGVSYWLIYRWRSKNPFRPVRF